MRRRASSIWQREDRGGIFSRRVGLRPGLKARLDEPGLDSCAYSDYTFCVGIYESLAEAQGFQWDEGNAEKNWKKHQVSNAECEQPFFNQPLIVAADTKHSAEEPRYYALGRTNLGRRLFIVFTLRDDLIRVISARDMSRRERKEYARHE